MRPYDRVGLLRTDVRRLLPGGLSSSGSGSALPRRRGCQRLRRRVGRLPPFPQPGRLVLLVSAAYFAMGEAAKRYAVYGLIVVVGQDEVDEAEVLVEEATLRLHEAL